MRKKLLLFILSLIAIFSFSFLEAKADSAVAIQSATATSSDELQISVVLRVTSAANFNIDYKISVDRLIDHNNIAYLECSVDIKYALESSPNNKTTYNGDKSFSSIENAVSFRLTSNENTVLYYVTFTFVLDEGSASGNVLSYVDLIYEGGAGGTGTNSIFETNASIEMNSSTGKGTLTGSINFASNTYQSGWYAIDLNYVREYYGFKDNIASATISCSDNQSLNTSISGSVNVDATGNVVYFALPSLQNVTNTITYSVIFGSASTGTNIDMVGNRVKIVRITNNIDTCAMAFSGEQLSYIISVDSPKTIEQVISACGIKGYDQLDGERALTYVDTNNYANKVTSVDNVRSRTLGNYNVTLNASDTRSNSNSLLVKLVVKDLVKPIIDENSSTLTYTKSYSDELISDSTFISGIVASDNYAESNALTVSVDSTSYQAGYTKVGNYNVPVIVKDPSNNSENGNIVVRVVDNVAPVITGSSSFFTSYTSDITASEIVQKCEISAVDGLDGPLNVSISSDGYTANKNTPGTYDIIVSATDNSKNTGYFTISVTVTDSITPYFLVNKTTLIVENGYAYTPNEILDAAISSGLIRVDYSDIEVVTDEYSENATVEGTYLYRLRVTYEEGEEYVDINLKVVNAKEEIIKVKWYTRVGHFFTNTFNKIGNFFSDIIYEKGIKKVFNFLRNLWSSIFRR